MHNTKNFLFERNYTNFMECFGKLENFPVGFSNILEIILKSPAENLEIWTGHFFDLTMAQRARWDLFDFDAIDPNFESCILIERKNPNRMTKAKSHTEREIDHVGSRLGSKGLKVSPSLLLRFFTVKKVKSGHLRSNTAILKVFFS